MAAIGFVNGTNEGFVGQIETLSIRAGIEIISPRSKGSGKQPNRRGH